MKHLLYGVSIAAALAIAAPALAQTPTTPSTAPAAGAPAAGAPASAPMASKQRHKRVMHHRRMAHRGRMAPANAMTEQLNREELARIQGGGMPSAPGPANAGAGQGGPRASGH
jgi:hypothetical protein